MSFCAFAEKVVRSLEADDTSLVFSLASNVQRERGRLETEGLARNLDRKSRLLIEVR